MLRKGDSFEDGVQLLCSGREDSNMPVLWVSLGHNCSETVKVLLCASRDGHPVLVVAEGDFQFIRDEAYDAAQFLATSAGNQLALNFTRFLDRSGPLSGNVNTLDRKVALAFRHLKLPAEWNVLGPDHAEHGKSGYDLERLEYSPHRL